VTRFASEDDLVGSRKREERCSNDAVGGSFVNFASQAQVNAEQFATNAFVECVYAIDFFAHDDFVFGFLQFGPDSGVGDWSAFEVDQFATGGRWSDGDSDVLLGRVQVDFDFSVDGFEDSEFVDDFQTVVDDRAPAFDIDDQSGDEAWFQVGLDLERFQTAFGHDGLQFTVDAGDDRDLGGDGQRQTQGCGDFVHHFVEHASFVEVDHEALAQFGFEFAQAEFVFGQDGFDQFAFQGQETIILVFEFHVQQGFGYFDVFIIQVQRREHVVEFLFVFVHVHDIVEGAVGEGVLISAESVHHGFQTLGDQAEADQVFVPESQEVRVQSCGQVTGNERHFGEGGSQFQIQTDFVFFAVHRDSEDFAVAERSGVDSAGVAKSHLQVRN